MANNGDQITETHDFMNVQSFSQLPFIRPTPVKETNGPIRLFGIEFNGQDQPDSSKTDKNNNKQRQQQRGADRKDSGGNNSNDDNNNGSGSRRFECQYCFRNFPTSQALGGHQNAHKRERQNAKRAYLRSTNAVIPHVYGFLDRHRHGGGSQAATYSSWNAGTLLAPRFYGSHGAYSSQNTAFSSPTITGSPLAMWRVPTASAPNGFGPGRASNSRWPILNGEPDVVAAAASSRSRSWPYGVKSDVQDYVSLDLHL